MVTTNLEAALRHIRRPDKVVNIWADAVCIDQEDLAEKSHQVSMMGEIYERCARCYVWLGCRAEYFEQRGGVSAMYHAQPDPFAFFHHFAIGKHVYEIAGFMKDADSSCTECNEEFATSPIWRGSLSIINSAWWTRVWTVQEIILPRDATLLHGLWQYPWFSIVRAKVNIWHHRYNCCEVGFNTLFDKFDLESMLPKVMAEVNSISHCRKWHHDDGNGPPLRYIMRSFNTRTCQDARDHVYGMLGLCEFKTTFGILPDYSLGTDKIYTAAFKKMFAQSPGDLNVLFGLGFNSVHTPLASWVPDFAMKLDDETQISEVNRYSHVYFLYNASRDTRAMPEFGENESLSLTGIYIDKVRTVSASSLDNKWSWIEVWDTFYDWSVLADLGECTDFTSQKHKDFWRTVISDVVRVKGESPYRRMSAHDFVKWQDWFLQHRNQRRNPTLGHRSFELPMGVTVHDVVDKRLFYITEHGSFVMGPPDTQAGDSVWVLHGGRVPFLLRDLLIGNDAFAFIGDCYVHGIMDGEALENGAEERVVTLL